MLANDDASLPLLLPPPRRASPRLANILASFECPFHEGITSVHDAAAMPEDTLGELTEAVRGVSLEILMLVSSTPAQGGILALPSPAVVARLAPAALPEPTQVPPLLEGAVWVPPTQPVCASFGCVNVANLVGEDVAISAQVDALLASVPAALLTGDPRVSPVRQLELKRSQLLGFGVSTLQGATRFLRDWAAFCSRKNLPDCGMPVTEEIFLWFLDDADASARGRASGGRTGASVKHGLATSARFLYRNAGLPFGAAAAPPVRSQSTIPRSTEPAWAEMWEVATLPHLLRLACCYRGHCAGMVRVYALGVYLVLSASLRLIDGLRSAPPALALDSSGHFVLKSVASLTKGRRRSTMQPLPWVVPLVSVDASLTDAQVVAGVRATLELYPRGACSLFPPLRASDGRAAPLGSGARFASEFGMPAGVASDGSPVDRRASPARLASSVCYLLCWSPLSLTHAEARRLVQRKHGPRHVFPELGRVLLLPKPARDELGYWKVRNSRGRLGDLSNRYSREGEEFLQIRLRALLLRWVRSRLPAFRRVPLAHFAAPLSAVADFEAQCDSFVQGATELSAA